MMKMHGFRWIIPFAGLLGASVICNAASVGNELEQSSDLTLSSRSQNRSLHTDTSGRKNPVALLTEGDAWFHRGYFSKALISWNSAWVAGRYSSDPEISRATNAAIGQLASLYTRLGMFDKLGDFLNRIGKRPVSGSATEAVQAAHEILAQTKANTHHLFRCGPLALRKVLLDTGLTAAKTNFLLHYATSPKGTNLAELTKLSSSAGVSAVMIRRDIKAPVPIPSIVHWKLGHFSAVTGQANGLYHIQDPSFPGDGLWVTEDAIDQESSGAFLITDRLKLNSGWHRIEYSAGSSVWGRGPTDGTQPGAAGDPPANKKPKPPCPMCSYNINEASVSLTLSDVPVGYDPFLGPQVRTTISYNQREDSQPATQNFFNVSPKWTLNWLTYVTDDPTNLGGNVSRYLSGGGAYYYTGYNSTTQTFSNQNDDGSVLALISSSPIQYVRRLQDGSIETYQNSDGNAAYPRRVFLTSIADPQGNTLKLSYDSSNRLIKITDASGRVTTLNYQIPTFPFVVSSIIDPFGRTARLQYNDQGNLISITDIIGITSSFTYDANQLVNSLTTPYGTTKFFYTTPNSSGPPRYVDIEDPLSNHEREEWLEPSSSSGSDPSASVPVGMPQGVTNFWMNYRNSFHWNKDQYTAAGCSVTGGCDYSKARLTQFTHFEATQAKATTINTRKEPLESRVWFNYPGQEDGTLVQGSYQNPIATGRVLSDGTSQINLVDYDTSGFYKPTRIVDPAGRTTTFAYSNHVDLSSINQQVASGAQETLAQFVYNSQHRPVVYKDAAGGTTTYTYNSSGQLLSETNTLGQTTSFTYNAQGDLLTIVNANSVTQAAFTYDAFDRVATYTDSEGWKVSYQYDAADRLISVTYPDGTSEHYTYKRLDLVSWTNRSNRTWTYTYDAGRRLVSVTMPDGTFQSFARNGQGQLTALTDARGHVTRYAYDIQGRLTSKAYADGKGITLNYDPSVSLLTSRVDALEQTTTYTYEVDNLLRSVAYPGAINPTPGVTYVWDSFYPRLSSMTDGSGMSQFTYGPVDSDGALQLTGEVGPQTGSTRSYAYDALGRMSTRSVSGSANETFQYDTLGRETQHVSDLGTFTMTYLGQTNQIVSRALNSSATLATTWSYLTNQNDRRLSGINNTGLSASQTSNFTIGSNVLGQVTSQTQTSDVTSPSTATDSRLLTYNAVNEAVTLNGQNLAYDANGNLLSDGTRQLTWDAENRLLSVSWSGQIGKQITYSYDGLGRRVSQSVTAASGGTPENTTWLWCGNRICQSRDGSNAVAREFLTEGEYIPGSTPQPLYYGVDQIGSVRRVFASTTNAPAYDYDAYGTPLQTDPSLAQRGFAGMLVETQGGTNATLFRIYDPNLMRWLSRDPAGESTDPDLNLYAYVGGGPLNYVDTNGLAGDLEINMSMPISGQLSFPNGGDPYDASTPVGRRGQPHRIPPGTNPPCDNLGGRPYSGHALDRMQEYGVPPSAVEDAITNGTESPGNRPDTTFHLGRSGVRVIINNGGRVITVMPPK